jgi:HAD superfamily hydrolase (TIGR01509 family)
LDFDGPICWLFSSHSTREIVPKVAALVEARLPGLLTPEDWVSGDPLGILRAVTAAEGPGSDLVRRVEGRLAEEEEIAAGSAHPTPYADPLIRTLSSIGCTMAVTSNNSPGAISRYLSHRKLTSYFEGHIFGRRQDAAGLKPDPDCLLRALRSTGADPEKTVMIGDTPADLTAAHRAKLAFIGYAHNDSRKAALLRARGARLVVPTLEPVLVAARAITPRTPDR